MIRTKHTAGPLLFAPVNPFKRADRRKQFGAAVSDYTSRVPALFRKDGSENRSNNVGESFWRGFHGERFIWDPEAPIWVCYRAGAAVAKATGGCTS